MKDLDFLLKLPNHTQLLLLKWKN